jgi:hypothetical protein
VKRTVAVAAVFLLGIMIWKPWDQRGNLPVEVAQQMDVNRPAEQAEETMDKNATMAESNSMEQNDGDSVVRPIRVIVSPKNQMNDIAFSLPETQNKDVEQEEEQLELPILAIPEELAEQTPEVAPLKPYTPIAKEATMNAGSAKEPLTVLAFIGDKIENRFEQSAVYTYLDKKRKAIFDAADDSESVRYERISTPNGVRQKLVLWGLEFQRSKRAR